ncbi:ribonuclease H-like [Hylaeus anthracinus]|uniref:ribonuclease H-like n=1 Tax=Hylaeus anthracinus TaxID=313031 RepID=UPI0023B92E47|nr:ribonuclease H-like [Hylaeus anthracinus]
MKTAMRLHSRGQWEDTGRGHSQIIQPNGNETIKDMYMMPKDRLITEYIFEKRYETKIDSREAWNTTTLHQNNDIIWYTDGSRKENLSGASWYCGKGLSNEGFKQLGKYATVYQAEVIAISECTQEMLNLNINCKRITICTDSQAAIKALNKAENTSRITKECKIRLNTLAKNNRIIIQWVPGHNGITGNEKADRLANRGNALYLQKNKE